MTSDLVRHVIAAALVACPVGLQAHAQTPAGAAVTAPSQPDFSGRWVLVRPEAASAAIARTLTVRQSIVRTNVYGAPMDPFFKEITILREFVGATATDSYQLGTRGGTIQAATPIGSGETTRVAALWEGKRLVIDTGRTTSDRISSGRTEVWQLDANGLLTVTVTHTATRADTRTTTATYRRN